MSVLRNYEEEKIELVEPEVRSDKKFVQRFLEKRLGLTEIPFLELTLLSLINLEDLTSEYVVSPKLDGIRKLAFTLDGFIYFVDRRWNQEKYITEAKSGFILDVEYILDTYVVLDVLAVPGRVVIQDTLPNRLESFKGFKDEIRHWDLQRYVDVFNISTLRSKYSTDGFVFQERSASYTTGRAVSARKWKFQLETVDLQCTGLEKKNLSVVSGNELLKVRESKQELEGGVIYECEVSPKASVPCKIVKKREDKLTPNSMAVFAQIMLNNRYYLPKKKLFIFCANLGPPGIRYEEELNGSLLKMIQDKKPRSKIKIKLGSTLLKDKIDGDLEEGNKPLKWRLKQDKGYDQDKGDEEEEITFYGSRQFDRDEGSYFYSDEV